MRTFVFALLILMSSYSTASEVEYRKACPLKKATNKSFVIKIQKSEDACAKLRCFAGIYSGVISQKLNSSTTELNTKIEFSTTAKLTVGLEYLIFAQQIESRDIPFHGPGEVVYYKIPSSVQYLVPADGVFLRTHRGYFRNVRKWCHGDAPECSVINGLENENLFSADVLYPDFLEELERICD